MTAYVIYQAEVLDPVAYEGYKTAAETSIAAAGGRYIVRGGETQVLEGDPPSLGRTVILEFETMDTARAWYRSEEYTAARQLRENVARARLLLIDGVD